jgi:hypothetical protein
MPVSVVGLCLVALVASTSMGGGVVILCESSCRKVFRFRRHSRKSVFVLGWSCRDSVSTVAANCSVRCSSVSNRPGARGGRGKMTHISGRSI